jgi:predicted regulator of Ras-like GTPase activity (Roadblock/LC7/MglB family)
MQTSIAGTRGIKGFIGACLVDSDTGLMLASEGGGRLDLDLVAALNTEFVKAEQTAIQRLGLGQRIEDILVTLEDQVHLIRPLEANRSVFVYVALDKATSNLGMARLQLKNIEAGVAL